MMAQHAVRSFPCWQWNGEEEVDFPGELHGKLGIRDKKIKDDVLELETFFGRVRIPKGHWLILDGTGASTLADHEFKINFKVFEIDE